MAEKAKKPRVKAKADAKGKSAAKAKAEKPKAKAKPVKVKTKAKNSKSNTLTREEKIAQTTEKNKQALLSALATHGGNVSKACESSGLDRATHYRYLTDPVYASAVDEVYEVGVDEAEQTIIDLMRKSEVDKVRLDAAKEICKARGKARGYGVEKREQKHSGEIKTGPPVIVRLPDNGRRTFSKNTKPTDV